MTDAVLTRIADALERMSPASLEAPDFAEAEAFLWHTNPDQLEPIAKVSRVDLDLLVGIDRSRDTLLENHILRPPSNATVQNSFERFIMLIIMGKRQIIAKQ